MSELTENTIKEGVLKLEGGTKLSKKLNENVRNEREIHRVLIAVRSELSFTQVRCSNFNAPICEDLYVITAYITPT